MNPALERNIFELAYERALDRAIEAWSVGYRCVEKSYWDVAQEIAQEYMQRFGESIEGTNPVSPLYAEYRRVMRNGTST